MSGGLVRCTEMEPSDAEKRKARNVQRLLYVMMVLMIGIPLIIFVMQSIR
jgi:hypothetical protein